MSEHYPPEPIGIRREGRNGASGPPVGCKYSRPADKRPERPGSAPKYRNRRHRTVRGMARNHARSRPDISRSGSLEAVGIRSQADHLLETEFGGRHRWVLGMSLRVSHFGGLRPGGVDAGPKCDFAQRASAVAGTALNLVRLVIRGRISRSVSHSLTASDDGQPAGSSLSIGCIACSSTNSSQCGWY